MKCNPILQSILCLALIWAVHPEQAFSQNRPILCGNEIFSDIVRKQYPALDDAFHQTFESAKAHSYRSAEPLTVHVVVHVVWKTEAENLDESVILDQIRILNEDFNRQNADTSNLRNRFKAEAGNAGIEFVLEDIVRVQTTQDFAVDILGSNLLPEVKHTSLGGSDAYDTDQYLNIWVCKIQPIVIFGIEVGQLLGFAFPPNNLDNWPADSGAPNADEDGVVIDYRVFGSNNPNIIVNPGGGGNLIVKGRTPVHEVGHYFGLRHIWGDGGLLGPNDCAQSDGIDDTPYANAQSNFDCDTTRNTCLQTEAHYGTDVPDLIENYMDYASEDCMNMFTKGQVELMRSVLQGPRSGLLMPFSSVAGDPVLDRMAIAPNPGDGWFDVTFQVLHPTPVSVLVYDVHGTIRFQKTEDAALDGLHHLRIDASGLPSGLYVVEIRTPGGREVRKWIKP